ncbi:hypothetical protein ACFVWX_28970 [Streptomyces sp. NPDC058220]|uniref:hypothetical protein n=1 Tax=Streptomyces sp. NPDC058220 TaxID=3346387 RepID=UPI0036E3FB9A
MEHASLPEGQDIEVAEASVRTYERMGWTVVDGQTPAESNTPTAGRRRIPKEGN